jgi:hypothetical protein
MAAEEQHDRDQSPPAGGAKRDELLQRIETAGEALETEALLRILRDPFCDEVVLERIVGLPGLLKDYAVRLEIVRHRAARDAQAQRLLTTLYWRDLAKLGADVRVHPRLRRAADRRLADRLPTMAVGEKIAMARIAGQGLLTLLRREKESAVVGAVLMNPRLNESMVLAMAEGFETPAEILKLIGRSERWRHRLTVASALCRNRRTPPDVALQLLSSLRKQDLRTLLRDRRLPAALRRRAEMLLGQAGGGGAI